MVKCAESAPKFSDRGRGLKSRWEWTQNFGDGGDRSPWGGQPLDGGGSPPHPPILGNPALGGVIIRCGTLGYNLKLGNIKATKEVKLQKRGI